MRSRGKNIMSAAALLAVCIIPAAGAKGPETYGIANASFPEPKVMAAGQPTGEQVQLLAEDGYKTILDWRTPAEPRGFDEGEPAHLNGLAYVTVPVSPTPLDRAPIDRLLAAIKK